MHFILPFNDLSRDLAKDVADLNELVERATRACTIEYFQLITVPLIRPTETQQYPKSTLNDLVVFNIFTQDLHSQRFRSRYIWRAWWYIRDLILEYIPGADNRVKSLNDGMAGSLWFKLTTAFWKPRTAEFEKRTANGRVKVNVTKDDWEKIPSEPLNKLLNQASSEICGYKGRDRWLYDDVFGDDVLDREDLFLKSVDL